MSKKNKRPGKPAKAAKAKNYTPKGGPFLTASVFCESALEDKDGVLSAMRIVDNVTITLPHDAPADIPSAAKPIGHMQTCVIAFKRGDADAAGKYEIALAMRLPDGTKT